MAAQAPYVRKRLGDVFLDSMFWYGAALGGASFITGLETLTTTIPIQSDANFLCVHTMYDTGIPGATASTQVTLLNGGIVVTLTDGATQRSLSNIPVPAGFLPCLTLYPAHPARDAEGRERRFDARMHAAYQSLLECYGDPEYVAAKRNDTPARSRKANLGRLIAARQRAMAEN